MSWHRIQLTDHQVATGEANKLNHLLLEFVAMLRDEDSRGVAVFSKYPHEGFTLYLTPKASELLDQEILAFYSSKPCERPTDDGTLKFLGGDINEIKNIRSSGSRP